MTNRSTTASTKAAEGPSSAARVKAREKALRRITGLLAKAESTTFEAEALAFTAKAHELMARYAIDQAFIESREGSGDVITVLIELQAPYPKEKFLLLSAAARASRCHAILGCSDASLPDIIDIGYLERADKNEIATVIGYRSDTDAVQLLFTSLLLQAVNVMLHHGSIIEGGQNRTRSFRRSFLIGFAHIVNVRLREVREQAETSADQQSGGNILPVLADRSVHVEQAVEEAFPRLSNLKMSLSNADGLMAGRSAAGRADLGSTHLSRPPAGLPKG